MPLVPLEPRTAFFLLGVVYLLMSGLVWMILRRHHDSASTGLWCGGGVVLGSTYLLFSLRGAVPDAISVLLPNALGLLGLGLRVVALDIERRRASLWRQVAVATVVAVGLSLLAAAWGEAVRRPANVLLLTAGCAWVAWVAHRLGRDSHSRAATLISGSYAFLAVTLLVRLGTAAAGLWRAPIFTPTIDLILVLAGGLLAGIFGNVGYVGLALEATQTRREAQARALAMEQTQRAAAEAQTTALRERLAERDEFVRVLAHEVRQPLNNASAALQAASAAMHAEALQDRGEASQRVQRAQSVIGHIIGSIDNTLAATTMLASQQPLSLRDADVNMLVELSLGDLGPVQRSRVHEEQSTHARTAPMDIGLMRLALRNLLANALTYSPADAPVTLRVSDSDEPLGLLFEVADRGPGVDTALAPRLFERGARGGHGLPGHGLGLYVVHQIMRRHGGQASWRPNDGGVGSVFRLWLPAAE